jgi:hypothetical protein
MPGRARPAAFALALTAIVAMPAAAEEAPGSLVAVERPEMDFRGSFSATSQYLCGVGALREPPAAAPTWEITANGARSTGTLIGQSNTAAGSTVTVCVTVPKSAAPYGSYLLVFSYRGDDDPPSSIVASVRWEPGRDDVVGTSQ